jgi:hypothetical protein
LDTLAVRNVQSMIFDLRYATIRLQGLGSFQLIIFIQGFDSGLAPPGISCSKVDQKRSVVERRLGILKRKLPD